MEQGPEQNDRINTIIQNAKTSNGNAVLEAIENQLRHKSINQKNCILHQWNKAVKASQVIMHDTGNDFLEEVETILDGLDNELSSQGNRGSGGSGRRRKTKKRTRTRTRTRTRKNRSRHRK
jgi:hypothetical protein